MRHAVAPAENVENHSFAVTGLFKICTHCERLGKKVRERREGGRNRKKKKRQRKAAVGEPAPVI